MLFELRSYDIVPGRVADELALVHTVACAPALSNGGIADRRSMWDKAGISLRGMWLVTTGPRLPRLCYLLAWKNAADRERGFPAFWADPEWRALRAKVTGLIVERIEDWLLSPSPAWIAALDDPIDEVLGTIHELRILRLMDGQEADGERMLARSILPHVHASAGRVLGAFEVSVGPRLPATVLFLAWPSFEAHQRAWEKLDVGAGPFLGVDHYLMEPMSFAAPRPNFGLTPQPAQTRRSVER